MSWVIPQNGGRVIFSVKPGSRIPQSRAQEIGEYIQDLEADMDITPPNLLDDARGKDSKLHEFFEWKNSTAAESWRLQEARQIINHFEIVVIDAKTEEETTTRAWHSISVPRKETKTYEATSGNGNNGKDEDAEPLRAYISTVRVLEEPDYHAQAVSNAMREVRGWQRRFSVYSELESIFVAIDEVEKAID